MHISDVLDILDIHRGTHLPCGVKRGQSALAHLHVIAKGGKRGNIVQKQMGGKRMLIVITAKAQEVIPVF